jgi:RNA polymerase sigma-70 factor (ECF subfamily)
MSRRTADEAVIRMNTSSSATGTPRQADDPAFLTTRWSMVVRAGDAGSPEAARALESLCQAYWYPLFAYVRRTGRAVADAEDLTQAFFEKLLEKGWLADADRERGRFRSFLLGSLKHFLANEWDKSHAVKRGGRHRIIPLDAETAERRLTMEPADTSPPDKAFDRRWALALLEVVLVRLRDEFAGAGKLDLFERLKGTLESGRDVSYPQLAGELGMSEGALRVAAHRMRRRYRELLRNEIAQTVAAGEDVDDELRYLIGALSG